MSYFRTLLHSFTALAAPVLISAGVVCFLRTVSPFPLKVIVLALLSFILLHLKHLKTLSCNIFLLMPYVIYIHIKAFKDFFRVGGETGSLCVALAVLVLTT